MKQKLNASQKRGLLVILCGLILFAGWRWRAAHLADDSFTKAQMEVDGSAQKLTMAKIELNAADTCALQQIKGIGASSARRIVRYRALVGGFSTTEQLLKVWGITPENFVRIEEQVFVDTTTTTFSELRKHKFQQYSRPSYPSRGQNRQTHDNFSNNNTSNSTIIAVQEEGSDRQVASQPEVSTRSSYTPKSIDINAADSSDLVEISGIGPSTARNIVKYRSLIFFFDNIEQLAEVWGIRPENLDRMKPRLHVGNAKQDMQHLNINTMTVDEMGRHKYLGFKDAKIIVAFRQMHGPFANFEAVQKLLGIDPQKLVNLKPYLSF